MHDPDYHKLNMDLTEFVERKLDIQVPCALMHVRDVLDYALTESQHRGRNQELRADLLRVKMLLPTLASFPDYADAIRDLLARWDYPSSASDPATTEAVGKKFDQGKPRWDLMQFRALGAVASVLTHGAEKYGENNWRQVSNARNRYLSAALRHMSAWWLGEKLDAESGQHHLAHAICCLCFLLERELEEGDPK